MKNDVFAYFNPRTPYGVRLGEKYGAAKTSEFQSTHPLRGATNAKKGVKHESNNFNPRTPCGVRRISAKIQ